MGDGCNSPRMISVPAEAFALLWAYSYTSSQAVPDKAKGHPDYPGNRDGRMAQITSQLRPYGERAMSELP